MDKVKAIRRTIQSCDVDSRFKGTVELDYKTIDNASKKELVQLMDLGLGISELTLLGAPMAKLIKLRRVWRRLSFLRPPSANALI